MSSSFDESRSWSELPPELLVSISTCLLTISDYVRFRSVCSSWRASSSPSPRHLPLHFPILLANHHRLLSTHSRHQILGSSSGYLALRSPSSSSLSLLNPLTLSQIHLPFLNTFPMSPFFIKKLVLSPPPPENISVLALLGWSTSLALSRPGRSSWTLLPGCANYHDALFFRGRFHVVDGFRRIFILDADKERLSEVARVEIVRTPPFLGRADKCYLVESSGELLLLIRKFDGSVSATVGFEVFRVGLGKEEAPAVEVVKSLGDRMLFLGLNCSVSFPETDVGRRPASAAGFRGNCIYFLDDTLNSVGDLARGGWDVAVYNMGDGSIRPFPLSMGGGGGGDVGSQICGRRPPAVWFTPGLC